MTVSMTSQITESGRSFQAEMMALSMFIFFFDGSQTSTGSIADKACEPGARGTQHLNVRV